MMRVRYGQVTLSLAFAAGILFVLLRHIDLPAVASSLQSARADLLSVGYALMVFAYLLRGARWPIWELGLRYWDSLRLILIGFMANNILPARLGEILRADCTASKLMNGRGRTAVIASIVGERILDGFVLAVFGVAGLVHVPVNPQLHLAILVIASGFAVLASCLFLQRHFRSRIQRLLRAVHRIFPGHLTAFATEKVNYFLDGLVPLGTLPRISAALGLTVLIWGTEILSYFFIANAVAGGFDLWTAVLFLVAVNFASLFPFTIGGIGMIEATATVSLASAGLSPNLALAMVFLQHGGQYVFTTVFGAIFYFHDAFHRIPLTQHKQISERKGVRIEDATVPPTLIDTPSGLERLSETIIVWPDAFLSIVIPAYNEQSRLSKTVLETMRWCSLAGIEYELVIADDGSRDSTLALARLFEERDHRIRVIACPHLGKGAAVRMGMLNARGRYVLFMDADGATPLDQILKLITALEAGADVAIGSRVAQRPGVSRVETSLHRKIIGRVFAFFVNLFAISGIADTQCGFKMFRRQMIAPIFLRQKSVGFAFDVEILFIARKLGLAIVEIPVDWVAQPGSKVNLITDSMRMLWDIINIRWNHRDKTLERL